MSVEIHYVRGGVLHKPDGTLVCRVGPKTGWLDWLRDARHASFRYESPQGPQCSVVREPRRSPSSGITHYYWYAHRRIGGRLRRRYLGRAEKVNLLTLEKAAQGLAQLELSDAVGESHN